MWIPVSKHSKRDRPGLAAILFAAGCAAGPPAAQRVGPWPESVSERRPNRSLVDVDGALPPTVTHTEARGVVSLREPIPAETIARFVLQFLDAWREESLAELVSRLSTEGGVGPIEARGRGRDAIIEGWRQRLKAHAHEFSRLQGEVARAERIEHWHWDEVGAIDLPIPTTMSPGEIYVSVPIELPNTGADKLFGDPIVMVVRPEQGGLRISAYGEVERVGLVEAHGK